MNNVTRKIKVISMTCVVALVGLAGCGTAVATIHSGEELARASVDATVTVGFGQFRLVRNGQEADLGDGVFASSAALQLFDSEDGCDITGKVGKDGEFAWALHPGEYSVSSVSFTNRGDRVVTPTNFTFTVSENQEAIYVGTITLEATIDSGYYGMNGTIDRFTVIDDCALDCAGRLEQLGLNADAATTSLFRQEGQLARRAD